jgi:hypothetical protein
LEREKIRKKFPVFRRGCWPLETIWNPSHGSKWSSMRLCWHLQTSGL